MLGRWISLIFPSYRQNGSQLLPPSRGGRQTTSDQKHPSVTPVDFSQRPTKQAVKNWSILGRRCHVTRLVPRVVNRLLDCTINVAIERRIFFNTYWCWHHIHHILFCFDSSSPAAPYLPAAAIVEHEQEIMCMQTMWAIYKLIHIPLYTLCTYFSDSHNLSTEIVIHSVMRGRIKVEFWGSPQINSHHWMPP